MTFKHKKHGMLNKDTPGYSLKTWWITVFLALYHRAPRAGPRFNDDCNEPFSLRRSPQNIHTSLSIKIFIFAVKVVLWGPFSGLTQPQDGAVHHRKAPPELVQICRSVTDYRANIQQWDCSSVAFGHISDTELVFSQLNRLQSFDLTDVTCNHATCMLTHLFTVVLNLFSKFRSFHNNSFLWWKYSEHLHCMHTHTAHTRRHGATISSRWQCINAESVCPLLL